MSQSALLPVPLKNWYILVVLMLIHAVHGLDRTVINILLVPIAQDFDLTDTELGFLTGLAYAVPFAIAGLPLGALADRLNRTRLLAALVSIWSACTALCGAARNFPMLLTARMIVGGAEAGTPALCLSLISDLFPGRLRSLAVGIFYAGITGGVMVGAIAGGAIAASHGWRMALFVAALPGFVLAAALLLTAQEPVRGCYDPVNRDGSSVPFVAVLRLIAGSPALRLVIAALVIGALVSVGFGSWVAAFLMREHGMTIAHAGATVAATTGLGGGIGSVLGGLLSHRFAGENAKRLLVASALPLLCAVPAALVALSASSATVISVSLFLWGTLMTMYFGSGFGLSVSLVPPEMRGRTIAIIFVLSNILGAGLGPQLVGMLSSRFADAGDSTHSLGHALSILALFGLLSASAFLLAIRHVPAGDHGIGHRSPNPA